MKTGVQHLTQYAAYHRDKRNIATHFVGVPMIVLGVVVLLSRPVFTHVDGVAMSPALVLAVLTAIYYVKLDVFLGVALTAFLAFCVWVGYMLAPMATMTWLAAGMGVFAVGWVIQFVGHYYEQKKPAFVDDLMGLIIGPVFVAAELAFAFGLRKDLEEKIVAVVGPALIRPAKIATVA